ncbi:hypothetical protein F7R13_20360 [Burkholderia territorii]|uniref:Uncharacterized protein n=1 Tax=Burkholderia territorii TaxID=1503055 RepID=A0A6L3NCT3_9BURK|nr:hypothetical protein F7R13_20360 [Burkholderia territorii]
MPVRHRTFTVPPFTAMAHKSRSHSNVGIFVHEAYHPQGLSQYDNDLMLLTETTSQGCAIHLCLNFFTRSLCRRLGSPVWRGTAGCRSDAPGGRPRWSDPHRRHCRELPPQIGKSGKIS